MAYDLTSFAQDNPETAANWIPESVDFCTVDGKLICKPLSVLKPVGLYYNSSMYSPEKNIRDMTMDEFVESLGDNKIAFMTGENGWTTGLMLSALIANEEGGVELMNASAADKLWDYNNPIIISAVEKLQKMLQNNATANTVGAAYADAANAFMSKSGAVICNGSWMASEFTEESKDKWSNDFNGADVKTTIYRAMLPWQTLQRMVNSGLQIRQAMLKKKPQKHFCLSAILRPRLESADFGRGRHRTSADLFRRIFNEASGGAAAV